MDSKFTFIRAPKRYAARGQRHLSSNCFSGHFFVIYIYKCTVWNNAQVSDFVYFALMSNYFNDDDDDE
jgi:hypothetical protein